MGVLILPERLADGIWPGLGVQHSMTDSGTQSWDDNCPAGGFGPARRREALIASTRSNSLQLAAQTDNPYTQFCWRPLIRSEAFIRTLLYRVRA